MGWRGAGAVALPRDAHLSDDEAVAKMGHPDLGHPCCWVAYGMGIGELTRDEETVKTANSAHFPL